jgi:hypothetical protein
MIDEPAPIGLRVFHQPVILVGSNDDDSGLATTGDLLGSSRKGGVHDSAKSVLCVLQR